MIPDQALMNWTPAERREAEALIEAVQARAARQGIELPAPPEVPVSCCGRGCTECVWSFYYSEVTYWRDEAMLRWAD
ncbi:oxidoreductase family protein [Sphaerotilus hippei]|uniref:Oxidoreductase family protein n=1 Tax=Sphaerotilus hippei TaxID=744406 RepID=A0A318GW52_9BURK|nr:oxidoreductase-like domain-containing protein [Sphaerotilus hippei]PXW93799.1 oxidoreductase family protein [Sphaerotilus hippei]